MFTTKELDVSGALESKERYEKKINDSNTSSLIDFDIAGHLLSSSPKTEAQQWQFHIAIDPTKNNLHKAAHAINEAIAETGLDIHFQCLLLNNPKENEIEKINWDVGNATLPETQYPAGLQPPSLNDTQFGKEARIYIRCLNGKEVKFELNQEQLKDLMLCIWAKLNKNHVRFNLTLPPYGNKAIFMENGFPSPFSCTPLQTGRELKTCDQHNPNHFPDPFEGIVFTEDELAGYGIPLSHPIKTFQLQIENQKKHLEAARNKLRKDFLNTTLAQKTPHQYLAEFLRDFKGYLDNTNTHTFLKITLGIQQVINVRKKIAEACPRQSDPHMKPFEVYLKFENLCQQILATNQGDFLKALHICINELETADQKEFEDERKNLAGDYKNNKYALEWFKYVSSEDELKSTIKKFPVHMRLYFWRLVHLQREQAVIEHYEKILQEKQNELTTEQQKEANLKLQTYPKLDKTKKKIEKLLTKPSVQNLQTDAKYYKSENIDIYSKFYTRLYDEIKNELTNFQEQLNSKNLDKKTLNQIYSATKNYYVFLKKLDFTFKVCDQVHIAQEQYYERIRDYRSVSDPTTKKAQLNKIYQLRKTFNSDRREIQNLLIDLDRFTMTLPEKIIDILACFIGAIVGAFGLGTAGYFAGSTIGAAAGLPTMAVSGPIGPAIISNIGGFVGAGLLGATGLATGRYVTHHFVMDRIVKRKRFEAASDPNYNNDLPAKKISSKPTSQSMEQAKPEERPKKIIKPSVQLRKFVGFFTVSADYVLLDKAKAIIDHQEKENKQLQNDVSLIHKIRCWMG